MPYTGFKNQLQEVRQNDANAAQKTAEDMKTLAEAATPTGFFSLVMSANPITDWPIGLAMIAAAFEDILKFIEVTVVLYGLVIVVAWCTSVFVFFMMLLMSFSEGGKGARKKGQQSAKMLKQGLVLLGGTTLESLFGINFIPWELISVLFIYAMILSARKQAREAEKNEERMGSNKIPQGSNLNRRRIPQWAPADDYNSMQKAA